VAHSPRIERLIESLRCLPGVGPKSAQRMTYHLLERDRAAAAAWPRHWSRRWIRSVTVHAAGTLSETELCGLCASPSRDAALLCVVESRSMWPALEQSTGYRGLYFVLMGHLSPLDGIGPRELGLDQLEARLGEGEIRELILATNPTVEGEATAHYIADMAHQRGVRATRIAHGVPLGGELEIYRRRHPIARLFWSSGALTKSRNLLLC